MQTQNNTHAQVNFTCNTSGDGLWSEYATAVAVTQLILLCYDEDKEYGELRVCFNTNNWNVQQHGLIYTDTQFVEELCKHLTALGYDASSVSYSEQGMQGDEFVSFDVEDTFIASWEVLHDALVID